MHVRIFESSQLEGSYVGDLLYSPWEWFRGLNVKGVVHPQAHGRGSIQFPSSLHVSQALRLQATVRGSFWKDTG